ncbi:FAD/NAD(P)-binding domain containing protein [Parasponia andersonii]|uniref:FAD/NAD(P)-binding domain containing protein n=1 Tax=Parasponia andersonii TaxID=3476 RepID=A0A2P5CZW9_PARAD|nr:FAD/NAD(P)-binding domain containing protein [Parasponia andersonii]
MPLKIAIVGGGLSGLIALTEFLHAGIADIIFLDSFNGINDNTLLLIPYGKSDIVLYYCRKRHTWEAYTSNGNHISVERAAMQCCPRGMSRARLCFDPVRDIGEKEGKLSICLKNSQSHIFDRIIISGNIEITRILPGLTGDSTFFSYNNIPQANRNLPAGVTSWLLMVTKHTFWISTDFPVAIWSDGLVQELYCLDIESLQGVGIILCYYALKDDSCQLIQPCDKKQQCLDLVKELAAIFPEVAVHLVPIKDNYCRYVFHNSRTGSFASVPSKLNDLGQDEYT